MDVSLFALRVVAGLLIAGHGTQKLLGWFSGPGLDGTAGMMEKLNLRPAWLQARLVACAETFGGAFLALGLLAPFAAAAIIGVMTCAVITVHAPNGPWIERKGYEYNLVLSAVAFAIAGAGPGAWSLDHAAGFALSGAGWAFAALMAGIGGGISAIVIGRESRDPQPSSRGPTASHGAH